jgi:hypothetical protein
MALGLLFLGGGRYTLSNSPSAVAALIISLFPKFPTHSNDNRFVIRVLCGYHTYNFSKVNYRNGKFKKTVYLKLYDLSFPNPRS